MTGWGLVGISTIEGNNGDWIHLYLDDNGLVCLDCGPCSLEELSGLNLAFGFVKELVSDSCALEERNLLLVRHMPNPQSFYTH